MTDLYPLRMLPAFDPRPWGTTDLSPIYPDHKFDEKIGEAWLTGDDCRVGNGPLAGGHVEFDNLKSSESPFTYSISGRFAQTANSSIYARVATGFRPGGPNVLPPNVPAGTPLTYKSDRLRSYEAGWKASGPGGRSSIDLSAFYLAWKDIQLFQVVNGFGINGNGCCIVNVI